MANRLPEIRFQNVIAKDAAVQFLCIMVVDVHSGKRSWIVKDPAAHPLYLDQCRVTLRDFVTGCGV
jgi:hypothetical protein